MRVISFYFEITNQRSFEFVRAESLNELLCHRLITVLIHHIQLICRLGYIREQLPHISCCSSYAV
ncbi:hypothetical protein V1478_004625 [Vespula squamosa]|uniref:Uncharacterized protein n=1 Tax=Vespula squamosa TaxID=30214 RepID=A0ABD2BGQ3_VESSQ